ncbi:hypothetical protein FRX31_033048 [Thalictrum thalictroides]|uniref:Uncharacterized protein n=1 Tax=Thalictrum thalictroides TaxID=46969 RepID=A0A7J6UZ84_THATH|nr:hypothetical protein FRX31_033048 [Thalictrum thalictroides]
MKEEEAIKTKGYYYVCHQNPNSPLKLQFLKIKNPSSQSHQQQQVLEKLKTQAVVDDVMNKILLSKRAPMTSTQNKRQKRFADFEAETGMIPEATQELITNMLEIGFTDTQILDMILFAEAKRCGKKPVVPFRGKKKFKCTICKNRSFFAHQGLDAHMSISHRERARTL